eukprot:CAMPEP_0170402488 /NCGR_PEP_ID=MMETSP0117_2-20130122/25589_1 /TAXON_ID=400756 /ORGANISM="Durinskia baltica, Strain CSIRO CS-38" /LENGTH=128 /DNA_ID=CAMNT_0010659369 /DNA_START=76 /DNA_END=459 /DNA_ORIENTATION=+
MLEQVRRQCQSERKRTSTAPIPREPYAAYSVASLSLSTQLDTAIGCASPSPDLPSASPSKFEHDSAAPADVCTACAGKRSLSACPRHTTSSIDISALLCVIDTPPMINMAEAASKAATKHTAGKSLRR